ncbi:MAG TPA: hypothetical protein VIC28_04895 [Thermoanaerobaculia bacterium]|jgi:hypothetical protein
MAPLYPQIHVALRSRNRFALVSAIRYSLRQAGTSPAEIERFSQEALSTQDPRRFEELCSHWVRMDRSSPAGAD